MSLLRWAGGKSHLIADLTPVCLSYLRAHPGARIVSPFHGMGAIERAVVSACLEKPTVVVAEPVPELYSLYAALRTSYGAETLYSELIRADARLRPVFGFNTLREDALKVRKANYIDVRDTVPGDATAVQIAVRFLWLSGVSYRGLWRVNRRGEMNTPPDDDRLMAEWPFPKLEDLRAEAAYMQRIQSFYVDWSEALANTREEDLIISDPPYMHSYDQYTAARFSVTEQHTLARTLGACAARGCAVLAFNSAPATHLYAPLVGSNPTLFVVRNSMRHERMRNEQGAAFEIIAMTREVNALYEGAPPETVLEDF